MIEVRETEEFREWLDRLTDARAIRSITQRVVRFQLGLLGDIRPVGDGVLEARIHHGPGYRMYFVRRGTILIILLCGGEKGSQTRDIAKAKALATQSEGN